MEVEVASRALCDEVQHSLARDHFLRSVSDHTSTFEVLSFDCSVLGAAIKAHCYQVESRMRYEVEQVLILRPGTLNTTRLRPLINTSSPVQGLKTRRRTRSV
jgi:hypothetical protein